MCLENNEQSKSDFGTRVCAHAHVCMRVGDVYGAVGKVQSVEVLKAEFRLFSVGSMAPLEI